MADKITQETVISTKFFFFGYKDDIEKVIKAGFKFDTGTCSCSHPFNSGIHRLFFTHTLQPLSPSHT